MFKKPFSVLVVTFVTFSAAAFLFKFYSSKNSDQPISSSKNLSDSLNNVTQNTETKLAEISTTVEQKTLEKKSPKKTKAKKKKITKSHKKADKKNKSHPKITKTESDTNQLVVEKDESKPEKSEPKAEPWQFLDFTKLWNPKIKGHHNIGAGIVGTKISYYQRVDFVYDPDHYLYNQKPSYSNYGGGVNFNYKYTLNFDNFFVAPGIFLDLLKMTGRGRNATTDSGDPDNGSQVRAKFKNRYGAKVDFGYDINQTFSPYFTVGYAAMSYSSRAVLTYDATTFDSYVRNGTARSWLYGGGLTMNYDKDLAFNIEYNTQNFVVKTTVPDGSYTNWNLLYKGRLQTLTAGVVKKF